MAFPKKSAKPNPFAPAEGGAAPPNSPFPAKKKAKGKKKSAAPAKPGLAMHGLRRYEE